MRRGTRALFFIFLCLVAPAAQAQGDAQAKIGSWERDPFWTIFVAYERAELAFLRFSNRFCAFPDNTPGVLGGRRNMREQLNLAKDKINAIWPDRLDKAFRPFAYRHSEKTQRCEDKVSAREAFGAALVAVDFVEFSLDTFERERLWREKD